MGGGRVTPGTLADVPAALPSCDRYGVEGYYVVKLASTAQIDLPRLKSELTLRSPFLTNSILVYLHLCLSIPN